MLNLTVSDPGVDEHHFLSELLEYGLTHDQLNVSEILAYESIARRYQLWEDVYATALRESESGDLSSDWLDERRVFLGHSRSKGHALVSPLLEEWVAERLQKESAILKECRKGREERALARGADPEGAAADSGGRSRGRGKKRGK